MTTRLPCRQAGPTWYGPRNPSACSSDPCRKWQSILYQNPALDGVRAIGGTTIILYSAHSDSGERIIRRLGFTAQPHRGKLGKFGNFIE